MLPAAGEPTETGSVTAPGTRHPAPAEPTETGGLEAGEDRLEFRERHA
jgi:hypothetical protein